MANLTIHGNITIVIDMEPKLIAVKPVVDSDGFWTDYAWYQMPDGTHRFIFGDRDIYGPEDSPDWECDSWEEAHDWFANYEGFDDEDEDMENYFGDLEELLDWMNIR